MGKLLEVKEYETIIGNDKYANQYKCMDKDFSKVVMDRNTRDYDALMKWSKVFLKDKSFTTFRVQKMQEHYYSQWKNYLNHMWLRT